ncbi:TcaA 3rd/4th domain-containing protein [Inconstantimicrobium porci]|uniref:TcaA 4th domain-containing protein n=1 Tax=Inconstantimicrobium porci TaxID=2652291 RepID=A0A7X2MX36_9CLOT|nr:hypothetical protein [Inconstantimicrobium porci]MSR90682.1 hypothetical protein [Inconstantimicrobium porci]
MIAKIKEFIKNININIQIFSARDKKKTVAIFCIAAVFVLFLIGFLIGRLAFSKEYTLNNLENALNKKKYYKINTYCRIESDDRTGRNEFKPFADYFSNESRVNSLITDLKNKGRYCDFVELKNRKWLFFDNYYVEVKRIDIKVNVNFAGTVIYLNNQQKYVTKKDNELVTLKNIVPGVYKLRAVNNNSFGQLNFEKEITAVSSSTLFNVDLKGTRISISSDFQDADVYINDKKSDIKAGDFINKGPFAADKGTEIYIEKTFPWGTIQSEKVKVTENPVIHLKMNLNNDTLDAILNKSVEESVKSIFDAMNAEDMNIIKAENKEKIYNEFVVERRLLRNQYELSHYDFKINESEVVKKDNTFYANIYTTLKYKVSKKLFGIELHSENKEKKMFFKIQMNVDETWKVVDIYAIK